MWNALKVFREYGLVSVRRRFINKKFHRYPGMDVISRIHVVPQEVLELQRKHVFSQIHTIHSDFNIRNPRHFQPCCRSACTWRTENSYTREVRRLFRFPHRQHLPALRL